MEILGKNKRPQAMAISKKAFFLLPSIRRTLQCALT